MDQTAKSLARGAETAPRIDLSRPLTVVVCGVAGVGKSTLGAALARRLDACFLDADDFHPPENVAKMRAGVALDDDDRAPWLTALNAELRARSDAGDAVVLACSALKARYRERIAEQAGPVQWIFLDGEPALIAGRMRERSDHYMPPSLLSSQLEALERPTSAICISIALSREEQVLAALTALLADRQDAPAVLAGIESAAASD